LFRARLHPPSILPFHNIFYPYSHQMMLRSISFPPRIFQVMLLLFLNDFGSFFRLHMEAYYTFLCGAIHSLFSLPSSNMFLCFRSHCVPFPFRLSHRRKILLFPKIRRFSFYIEVCYLFFLHTKYVTIVYKYSPF